MFVMKDLYIMQIEKTGAIKIGVSKNPESRIKQLQTSCPYKIRMILKLEKHGYLEKQLHDRLRKFRTTRSNQEWFDFDSLSELPDWIYEKLDLDMVNTWWDK